MFTWKPFRRRIEELHAKVAMVAVVLVSSGVFIYSFMLRDRESKRPLDSAIFEQRLAAANRPGSPTPYAGLSSGGSRPAPAVAAAAPAPAAAAPAAVADVLPTQPDPTATASQGPTAASLHPDASHPFFSKSSVSPAAASAAPDRSVVAQALQSIGRAIAAARGAQPRRASRSLRGFSGGAAGGTAGIGGAHSSASGAEAASAAAPSDAGAAGAAGAPVGASGGLAAGGVSGGSDGGTGSGNSGSGGNGGNGNSAGGTGGVNPSVAMATKQEIMDMRANVVLVTECLRNGCGKPGLSLAVAALKLRKKELNQADADIKHAKSALTRNGLGSGESAAVAALAQPLTVDISSVTAIRKQVAASINCLQQLEKQPAFPGATSASGAPMKCPTNANCAKPPVHSNSAERCHQRAIDALKGAGDIATDLEVQKQTDSATLTALAASDTKQSSLISNLNGKVSGDLDKAVSKLGLPPVADPACPSNADCAPAPQAAPTAAEKKVAAAERKKAPAMITAATNAQTQVTQTLTWANSGVLPAGSQKDQLAASLGDALKNLAAAISEWTLVGQAQKPDALLVTSASRDTVAALGDLQASRDTLKALANGASGTVKKGQAAAPTKSVCAKE